MLSLRPILYLIGHLLVALAAWMLIPLALDMLDGRTDWTAFAAGAGVTFFSGWMLMLMNRDTVIRLNLQQAFVFTTLAWVIVAAFGAMPILIAEPMLGVAGAYYESMSGLTTTGGTVIPDLDAVSRGVILWRALLNWIGGVGIIVMAVAILPTLQVGGMQLFKREASSDASEKVIPKVRDLAGGIIMTYGVLSVACAVAYWWAGMGWFDAIAHMMATISTGGYSTEDAGVGAFSAAHPNVEWVGVVFMLAGALPFLMYIRLAQGDWGVLRRDSQIRVFLAIALGAALLVALQRYAFSDGSEAFGDILRVTAFNLISIISGTGLVSADYMQWTGFAVSAMFLLVFFGGCAGSTSGAIKTYRLQILWELMRIQGRKLLRPHGVFVAYYNRRPVNADVIESVAAFFFLYIASFLILSFILSAMGYDMVTSLSSIAANLANCGPGLGPIVGPAGNYATLSDPAKWVLSITMLLGRLEFYTVLVLFSPQFWRT
jgi:trk system potassium uptake protein TrkH